MDSMVNCLSLWEAHASSKKHKKMLGMTNMTDEDDEDEDEDEDEDDDDDDDVAGGGGGGGGGTFSLLALEEMREGHGLVSRHGYGSLLSELTGVSERDCIVRHSGKHQSSDRRGNSRGPVCIHLAQGTRKTRPLGAGANSGVAKDISPDTRTTTLQLLY